MKRLFLFVFLCPVLVLGFLSTSYACCQDGDGDGYGNPAAQWCEFPELDCDDTNPDVNPGAVEVCNGIDDNCDEVIDDVDADEDGYVAEACGQDDCDDTNPDVNPGAVEACNGIDDNCDEVIDDVDADVDGFIAEACGGFDCDDTRQDVNPEAMEGCCLEDTCFDGIDNNCNGLIDSFEDTCGQWCMAGQASTVGRTTRAGSWHLNHVAILLVPFAFILFWKRMRRG